jgi:hypothetical protein
MFKQSSKESEESVIIPSPAHHKKVRNVIIKLKFFPLKETTDVSHK